jgi:hypothetical protein
MGGLVAQLLYRRHAALVSGLVLCSTARDVRESPAEQLAAVAPPPVVAALQWNPVLHLVSAEVFGTALVGRLDDPATASWAVPSCGGPLWPPRSRPSGPSAGSRRRAGSARSVSRPRWWSPPGTASCRRAASLRWPGRHGVRGGRRSRGMHHRAAVVRARPAPGMLVGRARALRHGALRQPDAADPGQHCTLKPAGSRPGQTGFPARTGAAAPGQSRYTRRRALPHGCGRPQSAAPDDSAAGGTPQSSAHRECGASSLAGSPPAAAASADRRKGGSGMPRSPGRRSATCR